MNVTDKYWLRFWKQIKPFVLKSIQVFVIPIEFDICDFY